MSCDTRSAIDVPSRTAQTPSVIGSSTRESVRERSRSTGAVVSPSTTIPISATASSGARTLRDQLARSTVPPRWRPARDDEVAHAREPGERVGPRPAEASASRRISARPRATRAAFALSPSESPSAAARGEGDHVLRRGAQLDAGDVVGHVDAEERGVSDELKPHGQLEVVARPPRRRPGGRGRSRRRCSARRGPRQDDPRTSVERRAPVLGSRPFVRLTIGAVPGSEGTTSAKTLLGTATTTTSASAIGASAIVAAATPRRSTPRAYRGLRPVACDHRDLLRVARSKRHVVAVVAEQARERRAPRARADDDGLHSDVTKSIETGTPSSPNRLAQLVLDPVPVVARHEPSIVHEEPEARRPRGDLRAVHEVESPAPAARRLARLSKLAAERG